MYIYVCFTLESWAIDWDPNEFRYSKTLSSEAFTLSQLNRLWQIWIRTVVGFQTQHQDHDFPFFSSWRYTYSPLPCWYLMDAEHFHTKLYHLAPRDRSHILLGSKPLVNFPLPFECLAFWAYYGKCNSNEIKVLWFFYDISKTLAILQLCLCCKPQPVADSFQTSDRHDSLKC